MADPGWLAYLKEWPALVMAGGVIVGLLRVIDKMMDRDAKRLEGSTEQRVVLLEVVTLLRTLCAREGKGKG